MSVPSQDDTEGFLVSCRYGDLEEVQAFQEQFGWAAVATARDERSNTAIHMCCGNGHVGELQPPNSVHSIQPLTKDLRYLEAHPTPCSVRPSFREECSIIPTYALGGLQQSHICNPTASRVSRGEGRWSSFVQGLWYMRLCEPV